MSALLLLLMKLRVIRKLGITSRYKQSLTYISEKSLQSGRSSSLSNFIKRFFAYEIGHGVA
jgi:hypothetical protein